VDRKTQQEDRNETKLEAQGMTVAFDEDLIAPMLAGWQKVADCYGLRTYVFRATVKIFAVTNKEQGFGKLVTIIEPTPRPEEPTSAAALAAGRIARPVRTATPPRAPYRSPELRSKRAPAMEGDGNGSSRLSGHV
jgi:hypothetical protein